MLPTPKKAKFRIKRALKTHLDLTETCFSGKTKMTMLQLRDLEKKCKKNKVREFNSLSKPTDEVV